MKIATISSAIIFLVVVCPPGVLSEICQRLNPSLFQRCIKAGHNYTAYFPGNTTLHENIIAYHIEREARQFGQCSKYLDTIVCSIFVPKCVEELYRPVLPCREVCEDFVRDCELKVDSERIEWIKGLCRLLPSTADNTNTVECFRPPNYNPRVNATSFNLSDQALRIGSSGIELVVNATISAATDTSILWQPTPLVQSCNKLVMPSCSNLGYSHTTQTKDLQRILDIVLKGKLHKFGNHSVCSPMLKKIFCAEFAPPCSPQDKAETVLRTVCKSECENVQTDCPDLYREHFGEYSYCEQMATEKSDLDGFCKLTKWPTAVRWPSRPNATMKPSLSISSVPAPSSSTPSAVSFVPRHVTLKDKVPLPVVAIVVSSVVIALSLIAAVTVLLLRKRRPCTGEWRVRGYQRHPLNEWETSVSIKT